MPLTKLKLLSICCLKLNVLIYPFKINFNHYLKMNSEVLTGIREFLMVAFCWLTCPGITSFSQKILKESLLSTQLKFLQQRILSVCLSSEDATGQECSHVCVTCTDLDWNHL